MKDKYGYSLGRRLGILALCEIAVAVVLIIADLLLLPPTRDRLVPIIIGAIVIVLAGLLYWLRHHRAGGLLGTINLLLIVVGVALLDPLGGTLSGASWSLFLIWPAVSVLVLRRWRLVLIVSLVNAALLIGVPGLELAGVIPVTFLADPDRLQLMLIIHIVVLVALTGLTLFISRSERAAYAETLEATRKLESQQIELESANQALHGTNEALEAAYLQQQELLDQMQQLEAPLIRLAANVLLLPLVGPLESRRIDNMRSSVLQAVHDYRAETLIIDMTGAQIADKEALSSFSEILTAAGLLGCATAVTGLSAEIVQNLLAYEIDLRTFSRTGQLDQIIREVLGTPGGAERKVGQA